MSNSKLQWPPDMTCGYQVKRGSQVIYTCGYLFEDHDRALLGHPFVPTDDDGEPQRREDEHE